MIQHPLDHLGARVGAVGQNKHQVHRAGGLVALGLHIPHRRRIAHGVVAVGVLGAGGGVGPGGQVDPLLVVVVALGIGAPGGGGDVLDAGHIGHRVHQRGQLPRLVAVAGGAGGGTGGGDIRRQAAGGDLGVDIGGKVDAAVHGHPCPRRDGHHKGPRGRQGEPHGGGSCGGGTADRALQQGQVVQKTAVAVFQKIHLAAPVDVLHGLVDLGRRGVQLHPVGRRPVQGVGFAPGGGHVGFIVSHHLGLDLLDGPAVDERDVRGAGQGCFPVRHGQSPPLPGRGRRRRPAI